VEDKKEIGQECGDPHELLFSVRRSTRYHNRRKRFFDTLNKWSNFFKVVGGSATMTTAIGQLGTTAITISASTVAVLSGMDLIFQTSQMARLHGDLAKRFNHLERELIIAEVKGVTKEQLAAFCATRLEIEADEPPIMRNLDSGCHNEMLESMGYEPDHFVKLEWYQRGVFAHFISFRENRVRRHEPIPDGSCGT